MPNGKIGICLSAIMMLIHPQLDGALGGLQVMLQNPLLLRIDDLSSTSDVLHTMRKHKFVADVFHRSATSEQGVRWRIVEEGKQIENR